MQMNLPLLPTQRPMRWPASSFGSAAMSAAPILARPSGVSTSPAISEPTPDRSRMEPSSARMAGFSAPLGPTRSSFMAGSPMVFRPRHRANMLACRGHLSANPSAGRSGRADDALFEDDIAVEAGFTGLDDRGRLAGPLVEGEALQPGQSHARLVPGDDLLEETIDGLARLRVAHHGHAEGGFVDEFIERHQGQHGIEHVGG